MNTKTHSSTLMHEQINLGTERDLKFTYLGTCCTPEEQQAFVRLFRQYCDVFVWTCDDLKTYNTQIIQHIIPIKEGIKSFQQKLKKFHRSLEPLIQKELTKLLDAQSIYMVRHSTCVSNLVPVRKKPGEICLCVDFRNLNWPWTKTTTLCRLWRTSCRQYLEQKFSLSLTDFPDITKFW